MKQLRILLTLTAAALAAMAVVGAASASAFTTWDINGVPVTGSTPTSYALERGDSLVLKDAGIGVSLTCTGGSAVVTSAGTVNTGGAGTVSISHITNCRSSNTLFCSNNPTIDAVNLGTSGWLTQLSGTRDNINPATGQTLLGWKVTCGGGAPTDTCTWSSLSQALSNDSAEGAVDATFDSGTPLGNCSIGGSASGSILGTLTITSSAGVLSAA